MDLSLFAGGKSDRYGDLRTENLDTAPDDDDRQSGAAAEPSRRRNRMSHVDSPRDSPVASSGEDSLEDSDHWRSPNTDQPQGRKLRDASGQDNARQSNAGAGRRRRMKEEHRQYDVYIAPAQPPLDSLGVGLIAFHPGPGHKAFRRQRDDYEGHHERRSTIDEAPTPRRRRQQHIVQHAPRTFAAGHIHPENRVGVAMYRRQRQRASLDEASLSGNGGRYSNADEARVPSRRRGRARSLSTPGQDSDEPEGQGAVDEGWDHSARGSGDDDRRDSHRARRAPAWGDHPGQRRQPRARDDPW